MHIHADKLLESELSWGTNPRLCRDGGGHPSLASAIMASPNEVHPLTCTHALGKLSDAARAGVAAALADWQAQVGEEDSAFARAERQQYDLYVRLAGSSRSSCSR